MPVIIRIDFMNRFMKPATAAGFLGFLTLLLLAGCSARTEKQTPPEVKPTITQFYSSTPVIAKGSPALLCYGVEGAAKVSLDPPVEKLSPSLTRCFEVRPANTTKYTLKAESAGGAAAEQSAVVTVGGAAPKLLDATVDKASAKAGEAITVCWKAQNATKVVAAPGKYMRGGRPENDCIVDHPRSTTTYRVSVYNEVGLEDSAEVKVEVK